jgi:hypothetical protein
VPSVQIAADAASRDRLSTLPRIPRPAPVPSFEPRSGNPSVAPVAGSVFPPATIAGKRSFLVPLAAAIFGVAAVGLVLRPRTGALVVTVSGPTGAAARGVSVRIDGVERCTASPCEVKDLVPGTHLISASAAGVPPSAERALVIDAGEHAAEHVSLTAASEERAGLNVTALGDGLQVYVDGKDLGAPPVTLADVDPGPHSVRIVGVSGAYAPYEEVVKLDRGEVRSLGPVRLHVLTGRLLLSAGEDADGAQISVDGKRVAHLPAVLEVSPDAPREVSATRRGFESFTEEVVFDGTAERTVTIALSPSAGAAPVPRVAANTPPRGVSTAGAHGVSSTLHAATTGMATLDLSSNPPAMVVLNGKPMGSTPLRGVRVPAGKQSILFVRPGAGRKFATTEVGAGMRRVIGVKF